MTTAKVFWVAVALAVIALVLALVGFGTLAYAVGAACVIALVLGLVQMTSVKKP